MSLNWERALIGTVLAEPGLMDQAAVVQPSDFTGMHQLVWAEMLALKERGALGPRALIESLRTQRVLNQIAFDDLNVRGEQYIATLPHDYRGDEVDEYVTQVMSAATKRELMTVTALIRSEAQDERMPVDEILDNAERRIMTLRRVGMTEGIDGRGLASVFTERQAAIDAGTFRPAWISKLRRVEDVQGFAEPQDYIIWAARPGQGKSSMLRTEFIYGACGLFQPDDTDATPFLGQEKVPSLFINMENSLIEFSRNAIAMISGISKDRLKRGMLTDAERQAGRDALDILQSSPMYVVTRGAPTGKEVKAICRKFIHEKGVSLIYVDYIQLMRNPGVANRNEDVSISSSDLKSIALDYGVPVHAASQLNRAVEGRGDGAEPQLSDLRESGSLEQDATVVGFLHRLWRTPDAQQLYQFEENRLRPVGVTENAVPIKVKIAKNRNGRIGDTSPILFIKDTNRWRSVDVEE